RLRADRDLGEVPRARLSRSRAQRLLERDRRPGHRDDDPERAPGALASAKRHQSPGVLAAGPDAGADRTARSRPASPAHARRPGPDVAACVHPSPGSTNPEWCCAGPFVERVAGNLTVGHPIAESVAPFMDTSTLLTAIAFYGHMEIYPKLKLTLVHAGAAWVPLALE